MTNKQISQILWEEGEHSEYYKKVRADLINTFSEVGCDNIFYVSKGGLGINKDLVDCDYYNYLSGAAPNSYSGKYMYQYSWAEETNATLFEEMKKNV